MDARGGESMVRRAPWWVPCKGSTTMGPPRRNSSHQQEYKLRMKHTEGNYPLYAISFNFIDSRYYNVFATVGTNRVTIYRGLPDGNLALLQAYNDEDKDEEFFTLSWAADLVGSPLLVAAGNNGIIQVINCGTGKLLKTLVGHGGSIYEIRTHPRNPSLIISASKDESVRLWNVHTGICILIFAGLAGHQNAVLSVDFHPYDMHHIASCGMDNTIKIWSMKEFWPYVEKSFTWADLPSKFPTKYVQLPLMSAVVHSHFVDCTRWLGDFILSKGVDNEIVLWQPKINGENPIELSIINVLQKYPVPNSDILFVKFSCDFHFSHLAIGNREGKIYVWEVQASPPVLVAELSNRQCKEIIRHTAMSFDGSMILACSQDGSIYRWDKVRPSVYEMLKQQKNTTLSRL
ncbi:polycomb group protein FIE2 isoform X1 [Brachypodium distachyon]|nr:polycomb group protein FIE2 isoform X1 [Brachypodium distachyon]XP_024315465.1 polycomb group protein FIE2 isoform X1 [Brachypodium distachyon]XP_024315466.1 polycomb group protein FIE2 isoform X1 [Brachypodium distachyon]XP_024315467.1 polycomb group protein FIE2 isoform X1 [Brachypodium distachyon]|eukprot:XP_010230658.1 polycomb group protein FIE2 isoform X1 [Brachypodium distachyon]